MNVPAISKRIHNLPAQPTPFFGRQSEIAEIAERLADPDCRLVTLTGAGGTGKTRLAAQTATELLDSFRDGVWFVPLQPVSSVELLAVTMAGVLGIPLSASRAPTAQLNTFLADKDILLILDNFEQLLQGGGAELLAELLQTAPALKLLVTSREALKLQEEWRYSIGGMPVPASEQVDDLERYSVIQLFVERARRIRKDFLLADQRASVVHICRLVEGVPLAVELAVSWISVLPCDVIAAEIERSLQFLHTDVRNIADRHRSMRTVFEQSWQLLSRDERDVFERLAIFHGGFRHEAAEQVADASLPVLATLVRKSLLRLEPDGRYQIHELLRQYAEEQLSQSSPEAVVQARDRHSAYYLAFLNQRDEAMNGGRQLQATAEIAAEIDNLRAAWLWAIERRNIAGIVHAANALYIFYQFRGRYAEGIRLWEQAAQGLDDTTLAEYPDAALLPYELGMFYVRLGQLERAQALFERCRLVRCRLGGPSGLGRSSDPLLGLGLLATLHGDYAEAQQLVEQARQTSERSGHLGNRRAADYYLAGIYLAQGQYQAAQGHAEAAYAVAKATRDGWFMAYCLNEMGNAARASGAYEQARRDYQASYALRAEFGDPEGMAVSLTHLGAVALLQGKFETGEDLYRRSLGIYRDINDQGGLVTSLDGLGQALFARGQTQMAARHLQEALQLATNAHFITLRLSLLISIGQLLLQTDKLERGLEVLAFVQQHTATTYEARDRVQRLLKAYSGKFSTQVIERGRLSDLELLTTQLQAELAALEAPPDLSLQVSNPAQLSAQPLIEPLTSRERELLQLLAAGLSYQQIAERLTIAVGSVKSHSHNIYAKLGVRNRVQAAARAAELGLL
jgi:predicted ATPase/DNA-binding CsgD family transcriptional regulator